MLKQWSQVVVAAVFEVGWVIGLKHASTALEWSGTIAAIVISFSLLIAAGRKLPVGTVYAVFVGLGTAGTITADGLLFGEPLTLTTMLLIFTLLLGVIGLKVLSTENRKEEN